MAFLKTKTYTSRDLNNAREWGLTELEDYLFTLKANHVSEQKLTQIVEQSINRIVARKNTKYGLEIDEILNQIWSQSKLLNSVGKDGADWIMNYVKNFIDHNTIDNNVLLDDRNGVDVELTYQAVSDLQDYLDHGHNRENRILAYAHSDSIISSEPQGWAEEMMQTKRVWGKLDGIPMYQFIISPDPKDKPTAEQVCELAQAWAQEMYPTAQWVIEVHDDNTNGITHAHIIVNSVLPDTGYKIHRTRADIREEAHVLQLMCEERGLAQLPNLEIRQQIAYEQAKTARLTEQDVIMSKAESNLRAQGKEAWSWQATMRDKIDEAASRAKDWQDFEDRLRERDISILYKKRGTITYELNDWRGQGKRRWQAHKMGNAYTQEGIINRLNIDFDSLSKRTVSSWGRPAHGWRHGRLQRLPEEVRNKKYEPQPTDLHSQIDNIARYNNHARNIEGLFRAVRTVDNEKIGSLKTLQDTIYDYQDVLDELHGRVESLNVGARKAIRIGELGEEINELQAKLDVAKEGKDWSRKVRKERKELEAQIAEKKSEAVALMETASNFLAQLGISYDDPITASVYLLEKVKMLTKAEQQKIKHLSKQIENLTYARGVLAHVMPLDETPLRRINPVDKATIERIDMDKTSTRPVYANENSPVNTGEIENLQQSLNRVTAQFNAAQLNGESTRRQEEQKLVAMQYEGIPAPEAQPVQHVEQRIVVHEQTQSQPPQAPTPTGRNVN